MKTQIPLITIFVLLSISFSAIAQTTPAIIADWMDFAGVSDTLTIIPVVKDDSSNIISVGVNVDSISGADILVTKLDSSGSLEWQRSYSSAGNNRDQAVAVAVDELTDIYVAGVVYSAASNFDLVVLKYSHSGTLLWSYILNGSANLYDAPAAIKINNNYVYVTGEVYDTLSLLNYVTIQLNKNSGALNWKRVYNYHNLYDVAIAMDISPADEVTVAGASQNSLTEWNYCSITYDSTGLALDTTRTTGTANSFDRPMAIKCDPLGNFYITGAGTDSAGSFNARTVKVDPSGNISWMKDYGTAGHDDEGNDLVIDDSGYVYVCGKTYYRFADQSDYLLVKYNSAGTEQWHISLDANHNDDVATKMCFDNYGNIVLTGKAINSTDYDFRTVAYSKAGELKWSIYYDSDFHGDDIATGITSDELGNIFVAGGSELQNPCCPLIAYQKVTIKYKTDYFLVPQDTVPAPSSLLFYPNWGQITDTQDSIRYDVSFYTINQFPKLYFHGDSISFGMAHVDSDTATTDTLERITMNFAGGSLASDPYTSNSHDTDQVLNYFLGHCPDGITGVTGSEKIMYSNVYENTDVIFSNNNAGMKFQIIMNPNAEYQAVLHFTGHESLELISNSDLKVNGILGSFTYERPLIYQLDGFGSRISLGWLCSYVLLDSATVGFSFGGSYDHNKPLVIECAHFYSPSTYPHINNLEWSTYFGGKDGEDVFEDVKVDKDHNVYTVGESQSLFFPIVPGTSPIQPAKAGDYDVVIAKFDSACILKWSTYLGGGAAIPSIGVAREFGKAIVPDNDGNVYVAGNTSSIDFPLHYQTGAFFDSTADQGEIFISQISGDGTQLLWSTYFGDTSGWAEDIDIDSHGSIFLVGSAQVALVPFPGAYNSNLGDAIIAAFDSTNNPFWVTHFGDALYSVAVGKAVDIQNRVFVTGYTGNGNIPLVFPADSFCNGISDMSIACFFDNYNLNWSTYWGGSGEEGGQGIAVDDSTNLAYVVGWTRSSDFPCHAPGFSQAFMDTVYHPNVWGAAGDDAVILQFNSTGVIKYATIYGDTAFNNAQDVAANNHMIYISGTASGGALPAPSPQPPYAYVSAFKDSSTFLTNYLDDGFLLAMNDSLELLWSSYYGHWLEDYIHALAYDPSKNKLYIAGAMNEEPPINPMKDFPWVEYDTSAGSTDYFRDGTNFNQSDASCFIARFDTRAVPGVGIEENKKGKLRFIVYPNPTTDQINLQINLQEKTEVNIEIYNSMGQLMSSDKMGMRQGIVKENLNISKLPRGVYLLTIRTRNSSTSQIIVLN